MSLGGSDPDDYTGTLGSVPVNNATGGHWGVQVSAFTVGNLSLSLDLNDFPNGVSAVIDSGEAQGICLPPDLAGPVSTKINQTLITAMETATASGECFTVKDVGAAMPNITISFSNSLVLTLTGDDLLSATYVAYAQQHPNECVNQPPFNIQPADLLDALHQHSLIMFCRCHRMPLPSPMPYSILGQGLLESYYAKFSKEDYTVSFARVKGCPAEVTDPDRLAAASAIRANLTLISSSPSPSSSSPTWSTVGDRNRWPAWALMR